MQYDSKWASSYANFGIALQFISEWSSGCGFVKLFKKFPRPEDIKIIKLLEWVGQAQPDKNKNFNYFTKSLNNATMSKRQ